jgi:MoaA/NifB/PqqE/SkfB family radical SAM enzyme
MHEVHYCGGCAPLEAKKECRDSFNRLGLVKVHWECWSECNLPCAFCYRTKGVPLNTIDAQKLICAVNTSGISQIVFAGGDPSIRPDIVLLMNFARVIGLKVEMQTNAHSLRPDFLEALRKVDLVGLSLDGPNANVHDEFRGKKGNFENVMALLRFLNDNQVPVIVRTIVAASNSAQVPQMAHLFAEFPVIRRWTLQEFSPIGDGYFNRELFEIDRDRFDTIVQKAQFLCYKPQLVEAYRAEEKIGTYCLITPDGFVYGTTTPSIDWTYPRVGSILTQHLTDLAQNLPFSMERHRNRYMSI